MNQIFSKFRNISKARKLYLLGVLIIVLLIFISISRNNGEEEAPLQQERAVEVASVASLSLDQRPLELVGKVESRSEAELRTERQGEITGVYRTVGSTVGAGTIIAEISNGTERAAVAQAEAAVEQAEANLASVRRGTRDEQLAILDINAQNASDSYESTKKTTVSTLLSSYETLERAVLQTADAYISNPKSPQPSFNLPSYDSAVVAQLESKRVMIQDILERHVAIRSTLSVESELETEIDSLNSDTRVIVDFFDDMTAAMNTLVIGSNISEATADSYRTLIATARGSVTATLSQLSTASANLDSKRTALEVAEKNLEQGVTGGSDEDIRSAEAALKQSEAALLSARVQLEKTLIRTPVAGTINTLDIKRGDFVNVFDLAAVVSNNKALQVRTYVTEEEKSQLTIGDIVQVAGNYEGVITTIAPGVDPTTRKIELLLGINESAASLTHGSSVRVTVIRDNDSESELSELLIPLSALKIETDRTLVFEVGEDSTLAAIEIQEGAVIGDKIIIEDGLTSESLIVVDARGLKEGQQVVVQ